jgi:hypothetical protein
MKSSRGITPPITDPIQKSSLRKSIKLYPLALTTALVVASTLPSTLAADTVYNINYSIDSGTPTEFALSGTITTDGTQGAITGSNVTSINLSLATSNGSYGATQLTDLWGFNMIAVGDGLSLTGTSTADLLLDRDTTPGVRMELFYDPMADPTQDSIYIETLPNSYYYYSATSLSAISLGVIAPLLRQHPPQILSPNLKASD